MQSAAGQQVVKPQHSIRKFCLSLRLQFIAYSELQFCTAGSRSCLLGGLVLSVIIMHVGLAHGACHPCWCTTQLVLSYGGKVVLHRMCTSRVCLLSC
jgi:hypothetical protein